MDDKILQFNKILGALIKELRESKHISAHKLANEYDLDSGNLSRIENGIINCKFVTLWKIVDALGMDFSDFVKMLQSKLGKDFYLIDE